MIDNSMVFAFCFYSSLFFVSLASIQVYIRQVPDFSFVALALIYFYVFQLPSSLIKIIKQFPQRNKLFRNSMDLINKFSFAATFVCFYFYLIGSLPGIVLFYTSIFNVLVQIVRYTCTNYAEELIVSMPFLNLVFSMCLMMIAIKFESPTNHAAWGFVLLWYYLFYYFSIIAMVTLVTCGVLFLYFSIFDQDIVRDIDQSKIVISTTLGVICFLTLLSICTLLSGLKMFMEQIGRAHV